MTELTYAMHGTIPKSQLQQAISVSTFSSEKQRFSIYIVVYEHDYK
jgi:hypothetical protein